MFWLTCFEELLRIVSNLSNYIATPAGGDEPGWIGSDGKFKLLRRGCITMFRPLCKLVLPFAFVAAAGLLSAQPSPQPGTTSVSTKHRRKKRARRVIASSTPTTVTSRRTGRSVARTTTQAGVIHADSTIPLRVAVARRHRRGRRAYFNPWSEPTYADSSTGEYIAGNELIVR